MMRAKTYVLLRDKIEEGIRCGLAKCEKRDYLRLVNKNGTITEEAAVDVIHNYIMNSICEYFSWDDELV